MDRKPINQKQNRLTEANRAFDSFSFPFSKTSLLISVMNFGITRTSKTWFCNFLSNQREMREKFGNGPGYLMEVVPKPTALEEKPQKTTMDKTKSRKKEKKKI